MNRASARLCRDVRCSAMWEREVAAGEGLSCPLFPPAVPLAMTAQFVPAPHDAITLGILAGGRATRPGGHAVVSVRNLDSAYGRHWRDVESRAQVPNQGPFQPLPRSEERRVGKECVRTGRSRGARYHSKKKTKKRK